MARCKHKRNKLLAPLQDDRHQTYLKKKGQQSPHSNQGYSALVRRVIWLQFRLAADSLRDLLLSPVSVIAALLGLLRPDNPS